MLILRFRSEKSQPVARREARGPDLRFKPGLRDAHRMSIIRTIRRMRVIGGTYRGRMLRSVAGLATRPTSDRLRETLFNILAPRIEGSRFLDICAGSGAAGISAL